MWISRKSTHENEKQVHLDSKVILMPKKVPDVHDYHITISTDANVSIGIDIPIKDICMISDVANYKAYHFPKSDKDYENVLIGIANSYSALFKELGINTVSFKIERADKDDSFK